MGLCPYLRKSVLLCACFYLLTRHCYACALPSLERYCTCNDGGGLQVSCWANNSSTLNFVLSNLPNVTTTLTLRLALQNDTVRKGTFLRDLTAVHKLHITGRIFGLEEGFMTGLNSLREFMLTRSVVHSGLPGRLLSGISDVTVINISGSQLQALTGSLLDGGRNITTIDFSRNELVTLDKSIFKPSPLLQLIRLSGNRLSSLPDKIFDGLKVLHVLDLSDNPELELTKQTFSGGSSLLHLNMNNAFRDNQPKTDVFDGLSELSTLSLSRNNFTSIPVELLRSVAPNLNTLDLSFNKIVSVDRDTFVPFKNLRTLDLSGNQMIEIREGSFRGLVEANELTLSGMLISRIENHSFVGLQNLTMIDLSDNNISAIERDAFRGLQNVRNIILSNNKLKWFHGDLFLGLNKLLVLILDKNNFQTVTKDMLAPLQRQRRAGSGVISVSILNNPITCNCSMRVLKDWLFEHTASIHPYVTCAQPQKFLGQYIDEISDEEYGCKGPVIKGCCNNTLVVRNNHSYQIRCDVSGNPFPNLSVTAISGNPLPRNRTTYHQDGIIVVDRAFENNFGVIACRASNILGHVTSYYNIQVTDGYVQYQIIIAVAVSCSVVVLILVFGLTYIFYRKRLIPSAHDRRSLFGEGWPSNPL